MRIVQGYIASHTYNTQFKARIKFGLFFGTVSYLVRFLLRYGLFFGTVSSLLWYGVVSSLVRCRLFFGTVSSLLWYGIISYRDSCILVNYSCRLLRYFNSSNPLPIAKDTGLGERLTREANQAVASVQTSAAQASSSTGYRKYTSFAISRGKPLESIRYSQKCCFCLKV